MRIVNVNYIAARNIATIKKFDCIISICDPNSNEYLKGAYVFKFYDVTPKISSMFPQYVRPTKKDMQDLAFLFNNMVESGKESFLIHCSAGISRSSAATLLLLMIIHKDMNKAIDELRIINPRAIPNEFMLNWIDSYFDLKGRLVKHYNYQPGTLYNYSV